MIEPSELLLLRVPIALVKDVRTIGLELVHGNQGTRVLVATWECGLPRGFWYESRSGDPIAGPWCLDLTQQPTADRLARWCAQQVGLDTSCGVLWHPGYSHDGEFGWTLYVTDGENSAEYWFSAEDEESPLYAINPDPADDRKLPDGSRYIDRLALRTIAVWLAEHPKANP